MDAIPGWQCWTHVEAEAHLAQEVGCVLEVGGGVPILLCVSAAICWPVLAHDSCETREVEISPTLSVTGVTHECNSVRYCLVLHLKMAADMLGHIQVPL